MKSIECMSKRLPFFRNLIIFLMPFVIAFLLLTSGLIYIGESMPLQIVAWMQQSDLPILFRPGFGNRDQQFKRISVDTQQPAVMVLGSSRVLQFRAHFLTQNPGAFYNAAAPAWQLPEIEQLLKTINHQPEIIVLGVDAPWFNDAYEGDPIIEPPSTMWERLFVVNRTFLQERLEGKEIDIQQALARVEPGGSGGIALGGRAIRDGHGFRNDGSEQYGDFLVAQHLWQPNMRGHHRGLFHDGEDMYVPGQIVSQESMQQMRDILAYAQEQDILLIGFMPPYMPSLWEAMRGDPRFAYIADLIPQLETLFAEFGYPFFDYSDGRLLGATDEDFFDGWHHSERIAAQLFINMARDVPQLAQYSDLDALQEIVNSASDTFRVFGFIAQ